MYTVGSILNWWYLILRSSQIKLSKITISSEILSLKLYSFSFSLFVVRVHQTSIFWFNLWCILFHAVQHLLHIGRICLPSKLLLYEFFLLQFHPFLLLFIDLCFLCVKKLFDEHFEYQSVVQRRFHYWDGSINFQAAVHQQSSSYFELYLDDHDVALYHNGAVALETVDEVLAEEGQFRVDAHGCFQFFKCVFVYLFDPECGIAISEVERAILLLFLLLYQQQVLLPSENVLPVCVVYYLKQVVLSRLLSLLQLHNSYQI